MGLLASHEALLPERIRDPRCTFGAIDLLAAQELP